MTVNGAVGKMSWTGQWTAVPVIVDGYLSFGNFDGGVVEFQNNNIDNREKVTISFDLAFAKLTKKHIGFKFVDAADNDLLLQYFDAYNGDFDDQNPLNLAWASMYRGSNTVLWERKVNFTIVVDYQKKTIETTTSCYMSGAGKAVTEATYNAEWTATAPISKFVLLGNINNEGRRSAFDNLVITTLYQEYMEGGSSITTLPASLTFPDNNDTEIASYLNDDDHEWTATVDGAQWTIRGFNNNNSSWEYIACGRKRAEVTASIKTPQVDAIVKSIAITVDQTANVKKAQIVTYDEYDEATGEAIDITDIWQAGVVALPIDGKVGYRYQLVLDNAAGANGSTQISKIELGGIVEYAKVLASDTEAVAVGKLLTAIEGGDEAAIVAAIAQFEQDNAVQADGRTAKEVFAEVKANLEAEIAAAKVLLNGEPEEEPTVEEPAAARAMASVSPKAVAAFEAAIAAAEAALASNSLNIEELQAEIEKLKEAEAAYQTAVEEAMTNKTVEAKVKATYISGSDDAVDTSYGEIALGEAVYCGYNKISGGKVELGNKGWNVNNVAFLQVDASAVKGDIVSVTLAGDFEQITNRPLNYGVGYNASEWADNLTWNTADRSITLLGDVVTGAKGTADKHIEFDITAAFAEDEDKIVTILVYETAAGAGYIKNPVVTVTYTGADPEPEVETGTETELTATGGAASNAQVDGVSYYIAGTYIAGKGSAQTGNMTSKGFKLRTGADGARAVFTVNEGYTITKLVLEGASNYAKKDGAETNTKAVKVEVDGQEVTFTGGADFQYRSDEGATSTTLTIENIKAKESIAIYFDNSGSNGSQLNVSYEITWERPIAEQPTITIAKKSVALLPGAEYKLTAKVDPAKFAEATKWVSSDEAVATVAEDGTVTAVAAGTANISLQWTENAEVADVAVVTVSDVVLSNLKVVKSFDFTAMGDVELTIGTEAAGKIFNAANKVNNDVFFCTNEGLEQIAVQAVLASNKGWSIVDGQGLYEAGGAGRCAAVGSLKASQIVEIIYTGDNFYTSDADDSAEKTVLNESIGRAVYQVKADGMLGFELDKGNYVALINIYEDPLTAIQSISTVSNAAERNAVYNLNGQKVERPAKGLYIVNGKKVVIK